MPTSGAHSRYEDAQDLERRDSRSSRVVECRRCWRGETGSPGSARKVGGSLDEHGDPCSRPRPDPSSWIAASKAPDHQCLHVNMFTCKH